MEMPEPETIREHPSATKISRCVVCGCDFMPTPEQWVGFPPRGSAPVVCDGECQAEWDAQEESRQRAADLAALAGERAKRNQAQKQLRAKKRAEAELKEEAVLVIKQREDAQSRMEALKRNLKESTRRNAPREAQAKVGLGPSTPLMKKRKCHTCGELTWGYNCEKCRKNLTDEFMGDEYGSFASSAPGGIHR